MIERVIDTIAVIGTGAMGERMVGHLVEGGYDVRAYDVDQNAAAAAERRGATSVESAGRAAAEADLSLIVVGTYDQVKAAMYNKDGVIPSVEKDHIVAISSTLSPEECITLAEVAESEGISVIDVPTCRGEQAAEEGDLLVLGGGPITAFEAARSALEQFAAPKNVVHFGELGSGQVAKTANNTLLWVTLVANYEVLSLAQAYGLDLNQLREALARSSGDNWALREWDWLYGKWAHKDMAITMDMAAEKGTTMPLSGLIRQLVQEIDDDDLDSTR